MSVVAIRKAFKILESISDHPSPISLAELTDKTKLSKPTTFRIAKTLTSLGYLVQEPSSGTYSISSKMSIISNPQTRYQLINVAKPLMRTLFEEFNEMVNLGVLEDLSVAYIDWIETTRSLRWSLTPHQTDPCYSTALGRAILAFLPSEEQQEILSRLVLKKKTPRTLQSIPELKKILQETQQRGWSIEKNETDEGIVCIGMPLTEFGFKHAALSITVPTPRFTPELEAEIANAFKKIIDSVPNKIKPPSTHQQPTIPAPSSEKPLRKIPYYSSHSGIFPKDCSFEFRQSWRSEPESDFQPGTVYAAWNESGWHFRALLSDKIIRNEAKIDHMATWTTGDVFEVFLQEQEGTRYSEIHVTPENHHLVLAFPAPGIIRTPGMDWTRWIVRDHGIQSKTHIFESEKRWEVDLFVPLAFASHGAKLNSKNRWKISFGRYDYSLPDLTPVISSTSSHSQCDFHRIEEWDLVEFQTPITTL